jgi:hypothetical protein
MLACQQDPLLKLQPYCFQHKMQQHGTLPTDVKENKNVAVILDGILTP